MAVTINGIVCQELVQDYRETADIQAGFGATKSYLCSWANRFKVAHGFLGLSTTALPGGTITLTIPLPYPELAAESTNLLASCYARAVDIRGVGSPTQGASNISYNYAVVTVTFGPFPWTFSGNDFMQLDPTRPYIWAEQHFTYSDEYITVPKTAAFFKTGTKPLDADWGFLSPKLEMSITLKNVPYLPAPAVLFALQAPINSATYLGCAPGYLLFNGGQDDPGQAADGTQTRDVTLSFSFRPLAPWDYVYNGAINNWDQVVTGAGNPIIARSDLSTIIPAAYYA